MTNIQINNYGKIITIPFRWIATMRVCRILNSNHLTQLLHFRIWIMTVKMITGIKITNRLTMTSKTASKLSNSALISSTSTTPWWSVVATWALTPMIPSFSKLLSLKFINNNLIQFWVILIVAGWAIKTWSKTIMEIQARNLMLFCMTKTIKNKRVKILRIFRLFKG